MSKSWRLIALILFTACHTIIPEEEIIPRCIENKFTINGDDLCFKKNFFSVSQIPQPDSASIFTSTYVFENDTLSISVFLDHRHISNEQEYLQYFQELQKLFLPKTIFPFDEDTLQNEGSFLLEYLDGEKYYSTLNGDQFESYAKIFSTNLKYFGVESTVKSNMDVRGTLKCTVYSDTGQAIPISGAFTITF